MRKLARLHKQPPSATDDAAALPESEYSFTLARVAVAQICQSTGFKGSQKSALDALTDIATRYLREIAKLGATSANSKGRTQSNLVDVVVALEDLASVQGFQGSSTVRSDLDDVIVALEDLAPAQGFRGSSKTIIRSQSLYTSAVIKDLMKFVMYADEIPFARPLPPRGRRFVKNCGNENSSSRLQYDEGGLRHVPRWLPAVPVVVVEKEEERRVKWWGCLEEKKQDERCSERRKTVVERETTQRDEGCSERRREMVVERETIDTSGKREKVRFKMGGAAMAIGNSTIAGNLWGVGVRKRVWCE